MRTDQVLKGFYGTNLKYKSALDIGSTDSQRWKKSKISKAMVGRRGGQVVSVVAFYSDDPSSNPAEDINFCKIVVKKNGN